MLVGVAESVTRTAGRLAESAAERIGSVRRSRAQEKNAPAAGQGASVGDVGAAGPT